MDGNHLYWERWASFLQRWGLRAPASTVLEAAGPLAALAAQLVYFGQPLLGGVHPGGQMQALAEMLENRSESRSFAAFLREEGTR